MINDESTYRYIKVAFDEYTSFEYSYIDDERVAKVGDYVWVTVGVENAKKLAHVKRVGDYSPQNAPYPVEKTKHIIRVATEQEMSLIETNW